MSDNFKQTAPDWSIGDDALAAPLLDLSELAPRLGSPNTMRRQGRQIIQDIFEYNNWVHYLPSRGVVTLSSYLPLMGTACLHLAQSGGTYDTCQIYKYVPVIPSSTHGFEISLASDSIGYTGNFYVKAWFSVVGVGGNQIMGNVQINFNNNTVYLYTNTGLQAITVISGLNASPYSWINLKVVIDIASGSYKRLYVNDVLFDDLTYLCYTSSTSGYYTAFNLGVEDAAKVGKAGVFDNLIYTIDEP